METNSRPYGHFCMLARALEHVGDRWTLLIVRDLIAGPKRFTDLMERLGAITPKTLTQRLRDLEADGLVSVDREPGRREVWYSLTPAGADLRDAVEELLVWGLRHMASPPAPGEATHPEHLLLALRVQLERENVRVGKVDWTVRVVDDGTYTLSGTNEGWRVDPGGTEGPDVSITTTRAGLAGFLTTLPPARSSDDPRLEIVGSKRSVERFMGAIAVFPFADSRPGAGRQRVES